MLYVKMSLHRCTCDLNKHGNVHPRAQPYENESVANILISHLRGLNEDA